jgi:hypothetical protein
MSNATPAKTGNVMSPTSTKHQIGAREVGLEGATGFLLSNALNEEGSPPRPVVKFQKYNLLPEYRCAFCLQRKFYRADHKFNSCARVYHEIEGGGKAQRSGQGLAGMRGAGLRLRLETKAQ